MRNSDRPASIRLSIVLCVTLLLIVGCGGGSRSAAPSRQSFRTGNPTSATPSVTPNVTGTPLVYPSMTSTPLPIQNALLTAHANGCDATALSNQNPEVDSATIYDPNYWRWYRDGNLWLGTGSVVGGFDPPSGQWYVDTHTIAVLTPASDHTAPAVTGYLTNDRTTTLPVKGGGPDGRYDSANGYGIWYYSINLSRPGCWEIDTNVAGREMRTRLYVEPYADLLPRELATLYAPFQPYPVPASCSDGRWADVEGGGTGPLDLPPQFSQNTLGRAQGGMQVWVTASAYAGQLTYFLWHSAQAAIRVAGHLISNPSVTLQGNLTLQHGPFNNTPKSVSKVTFPQPGCWQISGQTVMGRLVANLYVYPAACIQGSGTPVPLACKPPSN